MCCECGGGCTDGKRVVDGQVTEDACPETCFFSAEGCGTDPGPTPPGPVVPEQWEEDFATCDVTMYDSAGAKVQGADDSLCPTEIEDCFNNLCN